MFLGKEIPCPLCGKWTMTESNKTTKGSSTGCLVLIIAAVVFSILTALAGCGQEQRAIDPVDRAISKAAKDKTLEAYLTACEFCKMYAPSGINFTTASGEPVTEGHARWVTNDYGFPSWIAFGFVDSQNTYGAMRHQKWYASIVQTEDKWKLMFLKIGDESLVNHYE